MVKKSVKNNFSYYDCLCSKGFTGQNCHIKEAHSVPSGILVTGRLEILNVLKKCSIFNHSKATLFDGVVTEHDLNRIRGIYERVLDFNVVDQSHGLGYR